MRTVKNVSIVMMTALVAVLMTSCGGGGGSPEATAKHFLNALQDMDFEGAKKYATEGSAEMLDMMQSMSSMAGDEEKPEPKKITITNTETEGDKATVTYTAEGSDEEQTLDLVKQDGEWKVVFDKSSMGGMNMDQGEDEEDNNMMEEENNMDEDTSNMDGDM